jgi:hypothetical protein
VNAETDPTIRRWAVPAAAAGAYLSITALLAVLALRHTQGLFVYAQDDPYIHLAIARTLAEHGVWGVRGDEFASASSSPLWTLLMALSWKVGIRTVWWPFVVNVLCGVAVIGVADRSLATILSARARLLWLVALVLIVPLPTLAFIGMEHSLQLLLTIALVSTAVSVASTAGGEGEGRMHLLAMALVATRYEGLFVVAATGLVLWRSGRIRTAVTLGAVALLPVLIAGGYFAAHGGTILPNSVLMKSAPARFGTLGAGISAVLADWASVVVLYRRPVELTLLVAVLIGLISIARSPHAGARARRFGEVFVITLLLHAALVKLEFFYRYEAYLVALGLLALGLLAGELEALDPRRRVVVRTVPALTLMVALGMPLVIRAMTGLGEVPGAVGNVFEQQYQMGLFFQAAYPDVPIAVNDIGAVSWLSTSPIVDVYGLATQEVADMKRHGEWNAEALESLATQRGVKAAAVYERVLAPLIPQSWILIGEWQIRNNVAVSEDTVGFYAPSSADVPRLQGALEAFAPRLPASVVYRRRATATGSGRTAP